MKWIKSKNNEYNRKFNNTNAKIDFIIYKIFVTI